MRNITLEKTVQLKRNELTTLMDSMHSISSSLDLNEVLENIIRHALHVIPAADAGYLMLYHAESGKLIPKAPVGFNEAIYDFQVNVGESITGVVFESGQGRIFNSHDELHQAMITRNISSENLDLIYRSSAHTEGAICVPVSFGEKRIGVMIIHQWKIKKKLTKGDLTLLQGFAGQAGIAIENAQRHTEIKGKLKEITVLSKQLKEKNIELQKRQEVHETLTTLSMKNKGINILVDRLESMMKNKIAFFNGLENTFYAPDKKESSHFSVFEIKMLFSKKRQAGRIKITIQSETVYYLYPIYNGTVFLGCLMVLVNEQLSKSDQITLEQGGSVLALELVKQQADTKIYHRRIYEQFHELLAYKNPTELIQQGRVMGLSTEAYWMVAILEIPRFAIDLAYVDIEIHLLVARIKNILGPKEKPLYGFYNKIFLLISLSKADKVHDIHEKLQLIRKERRWGESPLFRAGLSNVYRGIDSIGKCYEEANKTLEYLANRNSTEIIHYDDIGLNRLFLNQSTKEIEQFVDEIFTPLSDGRQKELTHTLLTYIEFNRSAAKTAENLHIHVNTLYQRLTKIENLLTIDFNDSEDALKVQLACHLKKSQMGLTGM